MQDGRGQHVKHYEFNIDDPIGVTDHESDGLQSQSVHETQAAEPGGGLSYQQQAMEYVR